MADYRIDGLREAIKNWPIGWKIDDFSVHYFNDNFIERCEEELAIYLSGKEWRLGKVCGEKAC